MQDSRRRSPVLEPHAGRPTDASSCAATCWETQAPCATRRSWRADYRRRSGPLSLVAYLDILNVYGRESGDAFGWDERRGVNIIEGPDEPLPTIGLRAEYSWTRGE